MLSENKKAGFSWEYNSSSQADLIIFCLFGDTKYTKAAVFWDTTAAALIKTTAAAFWGYESNYFGAYKVAAIGRYKSSLLQATSNTCQGTTFRTGNLV